MGFFLEGIDYKHGYFTYRESDLLDFSRGHPGEHPHELTSNPLANQADQVEASLKSQSGKVAVPVDHMVETPDFIKTNYRRYRLIQLKTPPQ